jgi:hypothetical protein
MHRHVRQHKLQSLEFGDRLAEPPPLLGVVDRGIQRNLRETYRYTVVFLNPSFVGERLQHAITNSTIAFEHDGLTRGLAELCREAASPDNVFNLMAEGWSIQALAHISRISEGSKQPSDKLRGGLAGRSLRRVEEYLRDPHAGRSFRLEASTSAAAKRLRSAWIFMGWY